MTEIQRTESRFDRLRQRAAITNFKARNTLGGVFTALDRTLSGVPINTSVEQEVNSEPSPIASSTGSPFGYDPASFDMEKMRLRLSLAGKKSLMSDEALIQLTGYNYHELSHLIYGPPKDVGLHYMNEVTRQARSSLSADVSGERVRNIVQALMCIHSDHRILRQYLGIAPYLIEALVDRLRTATGYYKRGATPEAGDMYAAASYVLFAGRLYFPRSFRKYMKTQYIAACASIKMRAGESRDFAYGTAESLADEVELTARKVSQLDFYSRTDNHRDVMVEATIAFTEALLPFRAYFEIGNVNVFHLNEANSESQFPSDTGGIQGQENYTAVYKARDENNKSLSDLPDVPENNDDYRDDEDPDSEDPENEDGEGQDEGSEGGGEEGSEPAVDGGSEEDGSEGEDEGDTPTSSAGPVAGYGSAEHPLPDKDIMDRLDDVSSYVQNDAVVQKEVQERRRAITNPTGKQILNFADRVPTGSGAVTPEMTLLAKRVSQEFTSVTDDADPGFVRNQSSGRLSIQRAMMGDAELDTLFDRWDEGQVDATEVEAVYLIDISGSMSNHLEGVCRALWILKHGIEQSSNNSAVTALAYDSMTYIIAGSEERESRTSYRRVSPAGGTDPTDALRAAEGILMGSRRKNKSLVVLTDGHWFNSKDPEEIIARMNSVGVSTGLMYYEPGYQRGTIDAHGCTVAQRVGSLSDVLTFTRTMVRNAMTV